MTQIVDHPHLARVPEPAATDVTDSVEPPVVLFSGEETVAASRILATSVTRSADAAWAEDVVRQLGTGERAVVSLAFAPGGAAVAHRIVGAPEPARQALAQTAEAAARPTVPATHQVLARPEVEAYEERVRSAVERIGRGEIAKVVLGRGLDIISEPALDPAVVVARLLETRPGRYVFGVPLTAAAGGPVLVGGSPELLVRRHGLAVTSFPLAGSVPRSEDPAEDRRRATALRDSTKDLAEHAFVVDAITAALAPWCAELSASATPVLVTTDTLHHLGTPITARLRADRDSAAAPSALRLAQLLQPTPAVGGVPSAAALALIEELEGDRGPLAGAVGWVDADGDGEFAVTIRAGVLDGQHLRLFAGAGIVAESDPASEGRETGAKLATMLKVVGIA